MITEAQVSDNSCRGVESPSAVPWSQPSSTAARRAVAYYRHSAQDRQENSVEIQQDQVRKFAEEHGIEIVAEFADRGKSGPSIEGRDGFSTMLHDYVEGGEADFEFVLVLDVSRWGRFQETDLTVRKGQTLRTCAATPIGATASHQSRRNGDRHFCLAAGPLTCFMC